MHDAEKHSVGDDKDAGELTDGTVHLVLSRNNKVIVWKMGYICPSLVCRKLSPTHLTEHILIRYM